MNGVTITDTDFTGDNSRPGFSPAETLRFISTDFMHPDEVASDVRLTPAEKREALASWASDVRAVPGAPALRQLDNGAVVRVDDILRALKSLDERDDDAKRNFPDPLRPFPGLRVRFPTRLKSALRRSWSDDDDDPPPCPAMIFRPGAGPLAGGETADPGLMLAA